MAQGGFGSPRICRRRAGFLAATYWIHAQYPTRPCAAASSAAIASGGPLKERGYPQATGKGVDVFHSS
jgi:hypothetical protein